MPRAGRASAMLAHAAQAAQAAYATHATHATHTTHTAHAAHAAYQGPVSSRGVATVATVAARSDALEELLLRAAQRRASAQGRPPHVDTPHPRSASSRQQPWQPGLLWPAFSGGASQPCAPLGRSLGRN